MCHNSNGWSIIFIDKFMIIFYDIQMAWQNAADRTKLIAKVVVKIDVKETF